jgi:hypothetical protein
MAHRSNGFELGDAAVSVALILTRARLSAL